MTASHVSTRVLNGINHSFSFYVLRKQPHSAPLAARLDACLEYRNAPKIQRRPSGCEAKDERRAIKSLGQVGCSEFIPAARTHL